MSCQDPAVRSFVRVPADYCCCLSLDSDNGAVTSHARVVDDLGSAQSFQHTDLDPGPACVMLQGGRLYGMLLRVEFLAADVVRVRARVGECDGDATHSTPYCREVRGQAGDQERIVITVRTR